MVEDVFEHFEVPDQHVGEAKDLYPHYAPTKKYQVIQYVQEVVTHFI